MFRNTYPEGHRFHVVTVDEPRAAKLEGLGSLGRGQPGQAALLSWGGRQVRFEYDFGNATDPGSGRGFNRYFFLRQGVGEQHLHHANASTWPWYEVGLTEAEREQAWVLAMEAILVRHTRLIDNRPAWLGVARFWSGGREFGLEDFGYDAATVEEANRR